MLVIVISLAGHGYYFKRMVIHKSFNGNTILIFPLSLTILNFMHPLNIGSNNVFLRQLRILGYSLCVYVACGSGSKIHTHTHTFFRYLSYRGNKTLLLTFFENIIEDSYGTLSKCLSFLGIFIWDPLFVCMH